MAYATKDLRVTPFRRASQPILNHGSSAADIKQSHTNLHAYLETEFRNVEDSISTLVLAAPQVAFKEPDLKLLGMIRYAKAPWDPLGTGDAWVYWDGSAWAAL